MSHLFKSALTRAFTYVLVTLLVAGLLLVALRLALPHADRLRGAIAAQVGAATGLDAHLRPMAVRLKGRSPELQFHEVRLLDPQDGHTRIAMERLSSTWTWPPPCATWHPRGSRPDPDGILARRLAGGAPRHRAQGRQRPGPGRGLGRILTFRTRAPGV